MLKICKAKEQQPTASGQGKSLRTCLLKTSYQASEICTMQQCFFV